MSDDAELRARIEAQVAARRAGLSAAGADRPKDEDRKPRPSPTRAPRSLTPVRPWARQATRSEPPADPEPATPPANSTGLTPAKPWLLRSPAEPPAPDEAPAPSHPERVLADLAGALGADETATTDVAPEELERRRSFARRHAEADAALAAGRAPADKGEDSREPADIYPWLRKEEVDLDLKGAPTWDPSMYPPEPEVDEHSRRRAGRALRWLFARSEPDVAELDVAEPVTLDGDTHATVPPVPAPEPMPVPRPEPLPIPEPEPAPVPEPAPLPVPEPEPLPVPEPEPTPQPEPPLTVEQAPEPDPEAAPDPDPAPAPRPGADLARRLAEANAAASAAALREPDEGTARRPVLGRLFRRFRHEEDEPDDLEPPFVLPEPDRVFEQRWSRAPLVLPGGPEAKLPTVDEPASTSLQPEPLSPEPAPEPAPLPEPAPQPEPEPQPTPEPEPEPEPEPIPEPEPAPEPTPAPEPQPSPEPEPTPLPGHEPEPAPAPRPVAAFSELPAAPVVLEKPSTEPVGDRPRPRPHAGAPAAASRIDISSSPLPASPFSSDHGRFGAPAGAAASPLGSPRGPDLSRFLKASEQQQDAETDLGPDEEDQEAKKRARSTRLRRALIRTGVIVVIAVIAAFLLRTFVVAPYYIPSQSMEPTLIGCSGCTDDHILVDKLSYRIHQPKQEDIVVFNRPANWHVSDKVLIKRVIGLPGDKVSLRGGHVYINGLLLDETYVNKACGKRPTQPLSQQTSWTVPGGDVFVMGDNRCVSEDSRKFGPISIHQIIGRAFAIIWPIGRIRLL